MPLSASLCLACWFAFLFSDFSVDSFCFTFLCFKGLEGNELISMGSTGVSSITVSSIGSAFMVAESSAEILVVSYRLVVIIDYMNCKYKPTS